MPNEFTHTHTHTHTHTRTRVRTHTCTRARSHTQVMHRFIAVDRAVAGDAGSVIEAVADAIHVVGETTTYTPRGKRGRILSCMYSSVRQNYRVQGFCCTSQFCSIILTLNETKAKQGIIGKLLASAFHRCLVGLSSRFCS